MGCQRLETKAELGTYTVRNLFPSKGDVAICYSYCQLQRYKEKVWLCKTNIVLTMEGMSLDQAAGMSMSKSRSTAPSSLRSSSNLCIKL